MTPSPGFSLMFYLERRVQRIRTRIRRKRACSGPVSSVSMVNGFGLPSTSSPAESSLSSYRNEKVQSRLVASYSWREHRLPGHGSLQHIKEKTVFHDEAPPSPEWRIVTDAFNFVVDDKKPCIGILQPAKTHIG